MYMFSLMNNIYHYLDYVNEITVDRDILDIIKDAYNRVGTLPLELLEFNRFKGEYYLIKKDKIDQYKILSIPSANTTRRAQIKIARAVMAAKAAREKARAEAAARIGNMDEGQAAPAAVASMEQEGKEGQEAPGNV